MKKFLYLTWSVCLFVLMSCSNEESLPVDEVSAVEFSFDLESAMSNSRAISDGKGANQLMYGVFDDQGKLIIKKAVKNNVTGLLGKDGYKMTISLAKGKTYQVVFWAQNDQCEAYTISDDMKVAIDYAGINNNESRDAFFATTDKFKVDASTSVSVVLKRPFAQVNVGAFPFDLEYAKDLGMDVKQSTATIMNVPNEINLLDGTTEGEVDVTYSLSDIPVEKLMVDVDGNGQKETYEWLSMSYILANKEQSSHTMAFGFDNAEGNSPIVFDGLESVPVQRNYRTNIVGQILTGTITFNVKIDPVYEGEEINSAGLYYNFSENISIQNKEFAFNTNEAATFTSENNNELTFKDVTFSGRIQFIAFGEYRDKGNYVDFTNVLNNVKAENMVVDHTGIENVKAIDYMAPLVFLRGVSTLNNCTFTGSTTTAVPFVDNYGDMREPLPYDCGVPNSCEAIFNDCTVDRLYAWSHSMITLNNSILKYIRCSTHHNTDPKAHVTIGDGTVVDEIFVTSSGVAKRVKDENGNYHWIDDPANRWAPSLIIKAGARVKRLDMNHRPSLDNNGNLSVIIEEGAIVEEIVNAVDEF